MSDFRVPFGPSETEFTEKRSRFIGPSAAGGDGGAGAGIYRADEEKIL